MTRRSSAFVLFAVLLIFTCGIPAHAHDLGLSGIRVLFRTNDVVVSVTTPVSRLLRAEGRSAALMSAVDLDLAIRRRLHVRFDGRNLVPRQATVIGDSASDMVSWQTIVSGRFQDCEVLTRIYPEDPGARTVVALIRDGQVFHEEVLDDDHPALLRDQPAPSTLVIAARYVREGILHIFGGPDHILFVLGLLLLGGSLKSLLRTITAFTLAHSITLTLAATGVFSPSPRIVEPLIALSIVAVAVENLRHFRGKQSGSCAAEAIKLRDLRPLYAFGFGLIHGFGFAGALAEVGLPKAALGVALASFNVGVEIGQVTIVLAAMPGLAWLATRRPTVFRRVVFVGSVGIGIAGAYWFASRLPRF